MPSAPGGRPEFTESIVVESVGDGSAVEDETEKSPQQRLIEGIAARYPDVGLRMIETPSAVPATDDVDFSSFEKHAAFVRSMYDSLYFWLRLPRISDDFPDHPTRDAWLKEEEGKRRLSRDEYAALKDNKLATSQASPAIMVLGALRDNVGKRLPDELHTKIRAICSGEPSLDDISKGLGAFEQSKGDPKDRIEKNKELIAALEQKTAEVLSVLSE